MKIRQDLSLQSSQASSCPKSESTIQQQPEARAQVGTGAGPRPESLGGDHVGPSSRHKSITQRVQEELAEARALENAAKVAPGNVRLLRTWESLSPAEQAMEYEEVD